MKRKLIEHFLSIAFVGALFFGLIVLVQKENVTEPLQTSAVQEYLHLPYLDLGDPLDRALFKETLGIFCPDSLRSELLMQSIADARQEQFTNELYKTGGDERGITRQKVFKILAMFLQFLLVYVIVMGLSYYGAETLGVFWFVQSKRGKQPCLEEILTLFRPAQLQAYSGMKVVARTILLLLSAFGKGILSLVLFAPAYVIAYSFKTRFDTGSIPFMILLGVLSNGVLINYAKKFHTFLVAESRRGYVETAIVKNLYSSYSPTLPGGITWKSILRLRKRFPSHVFQHIYLNAHHQYIPTLKEQASFVITGLVIIEMALNIQGHLNYEMLKNILFRQYDVVLTIVAAIFLVIKATEIAVDVLLERMSRQFENRS
jgi:hypothetical protein